MDIVTIPVSKLVVNETNVRQDRKGYDSALASSILHVGLLQPLLVAPANDKGKHAVYAGSRRLAAIKALKKDSLWAGNVPCVVIEGDGVAVSYAENVYRRQLTPLEECDAFLKASEAGQDVATIAATMGATERYVRQRLALSSLNADLRKMLHEGKLPLSIAAVATTASATQQDEIASAWSTYPVPYHMATPEQLRFNLERQRIPVSAALFELQAYEGAIERDLFATGEDEAGWFADVDQFWSLQRAAAASLPEKARAAGWKDGVVLDVGERPGWNWARFDLEDDLSIPEAWSEDETFDPANWVVIWGFERNGRVELEGAYIVPVEEAEADAADDEGGLALEPAAPAKAPAQEVSKQLAEMVNADRMRDLASSLWGREEMVRRVLLFQLLTHPPSNGGIVWRRGNGNRCGLIGERLDFLGEEDLARVQETLVALNVDPHLEGRKLHDDGTLFDAVLVLPTAMVNTLLYVLTVVALGVGRPDRLDQPMLDMLDDRLGGQRRYLTAEMIDLIRGKAILEAIAQENAITLSSKDNAGAIRSILKAKIAESKRLRCRWLDVPAETYKGGDEAAEAEDMADAA